MIIMHIITHNCLIDLIQNQSSSSEIKIENILDYGIRILKELYLVKQFEFTLDITSPRLF